MALNTRLIKRRIKSISSTSQITKAMELVATSKMKRAQSAVLATRNYADSAWATVLDLANRTDPKLHPLLQKKEEIKKEVVLFITSNRGLCGAFNQQMIATLENYSNKRKGENKELAIEIIALGKKGRDAMLRRDYQIIADFPKSDIVTQITEISPISRLLIDDFLSGKYDRVMLAFADFVSTLKQTPEIRQLLPLQKVKGLGAVGQKEEKEEKDKYYYEYLFEPSPDEVLELFLPRLVEIQIFQAVLESNASEHAARMVAMKNASDNAADMLFDLTLSFNRARQAAITTEIADIAAGRLAIEH